MRRAKRVQTRQSPVVSTDSQGREVRRYTVSFQLEPHRVGGPRQEIRAATSLGELKAVAMATARLLRLKPEARFSDVEIVRAEDRFEIDPEHDVVDYWGGFE